MACTARTAIRRRRIMRLKRELKVIQRLKAKRKEIK